MAIFPGGVAGDNTLLVAADNIQTKLTSGMLIGDTVAVVASTTGWVANMVATCESEQMLVTSVSGANVLNVTRGQYGTSAAAHVSGKNVSCFIDAVYHNNTKGEVIAIETTLGANLSNIPGSPSGGIVPVIKGGTGVALAQGVGGTKVQLAAGTTSLGNVPKYDANGALIDSGIPPAVSPTGSAPFQRYRSSGFTPFTGQFTQEPAAFQPDFDFAAQTPGGTLTGGGGLQSITLTPCPIGIIANGAYASTVYISNGTGTAEACVCAGGTATSGSPSGTIQISPANNHSGAWTVTSATQGLQEALNYQYLTYVGGTVWLDPEIGISIHGRVSFPAGDFTLDGLGGATSTITRAADYPNGDLLYLNPSSAHYTNLCNLRIANQTTAGQSSGAAVNCTLNRCTITNFTCTGGYIAIYLDGAPGFHLENFFLQSGTHTSSLIKFSAAVSGQASTDDLIANGQIFANDTSAAITLGAGDGVTILGVQGGGGNPPINMVPGGTSANGFYIANVDIIGLLWDGWKNGATAINIAGLSGSGGGGISVLGGRLLGAPGAVSGHGTYAFIITSGTGSTPYDININGVQIDYTDGPAIQQNGISSTPLQVSNCSITYANLAAAGTTPAILLNGANALIQNNRFNTPNATWCVGSEGSSGEILVVGNSMNGAVTGPISLDMGFGIFPTAVVLKDNSGIDNVIGAVTAAATLTLPINPEFVISGATGVTAIAGTWAGRSGVFRTTSALTFTAGATIGNTLTTTIGLSVVFWSDATKTWFK